MSAAKSNWKHARWFALIALTGINYLNYIDRNIFAALLPAIKEDLKFTDFELGMLGSAFIFAYTISAPLFGYLGDRRGRSRIMSAGVGVWSVATAFSGICTTFFGQFVTRASVGFGESAYSVIAPSSIADHFPKRSRGMVFAIYSGAMTIGSALGYVLGGWLNAHFGWHKAFFVVGIPGLAFAILLYFIPDPIRGGNDEEVADHRGPLSTKDIYIAILKNGGFLFTALGYAAYSFVVGGLAFWMPMYLVRYFSVSLEQADVQFGTLTVAGGFVGTMLGGFWADRIERKTGNGFLKVAFYSMVFSVPLFALSLSISSYFSFMVSLFFLEAAVFLCVSPLDAAVIGYVRPAWRSSAMALNVFLLHALGDGISRPVLGFMSDRADLKTAMWLLPWVLIVAGVLWLIGFVVHWQPVQFPSGGLMPPRYQAHRGLRPPGSGVIENTLEAFRLASAAGAEMTECDVHLTRDGEAVVFHDPDLIRLAGKPDRVIDLTAAEMFKLVGAPRLSELLSDPQCPRFVNIEVKSTRAWTGDGIEEAVVRSVRACDAEKRVIFSSFNPFTLRRLSKLAPHVPRALIATDEADPSNKYYLRKMLLGFWARAHLLHLDERMINRQSLDAWRDRGIKIVAWTVDNPERAREIIALGAHGIISDILFTDQQAGITQHRS